MAPEIVKGFNDLKFPAQTEKESLRRGHMVSPVTLSLKVLSFVSFFGG